MTPDPRAPVRTRAVAAAHWRIADRTAAARSAIRAGADELAVDFGGGHRGPVLDAGELRRLRADVAVTTLAVNRVNDLGLFDAHGPEPESMDLLRRAALIVVQESLSFLHVPSFRSSEIRDDIGLRHTARALAQCADLVPPEVTVLSESTLGAEQACALHRAAARPNLRIVADTGNLVDAGHEPTAFVRACADAGVLAPVAHLKSSADGLAQPVSVLHALGAAVDVVLVENDYRLRPSALPDDIAWVRSTLGLAVPGRADGPDPRRGHRP